MTSDKPAPKRKKPPRPQYTLPVPLAAGQWWTEEISIQQQKYIARVAINWGHFEGALHELTWLLMHVDIEDGRTVTKNIGCQQMIQIAKELATRHLKSPELHDLMGALDRADLLREQRDLVIHGMWLTLVPDNVPMAVSLRPKTEGAIRGLKFYEHEMVELIEAIVAVRLAVKTALDGLRKS